MQASVRRSWPRTGVDRAVKRGKNSKSMTLTRSGRIDAHYQQGTSHHSHRDPRAYGTPSQHRGALRGGGQRRADHPRGENWRPGPEVARTDARAGDLGDEHRGDHGPDPFGELSSVLVDSNVILDVVTEDPQWNDWS